MAEAICKKIAIIGAGNVASDSGILIKEGPVDLLLDVAKGLAKGKDDLEDCASVLRQDCVIKGSEDFF